eukprot:788836-Prorocentrum_minimum.AAC.4
MVAHLVVGRSHESPTLKPSAITLGRRSVAHLVFVDGLDELVPELEDGQALALLRDGEAAPLTESGRLAEGVLLPFGHLKLAHT